MIAPIRAHAPKLPLPRLWSRIGVATKPVSETQIEPR